MSSYEKMYSIISNMKDQWIDVYSII
jgi:hypothetical protein